MSKFVHFFIWLFLLLVFLISVVFSFFNTTPVPLSLGYITLSPQPLSIWVIAAFVLGGMSGVLLGSGLFRHLRTRLEIKRLRNRVAELEQQINASGGVIPPAIEQQDVTMVADAATPAISNRDGA